LFNAVMGSIAGISLVVGGIGIMNIMLASVLERTREIGVRRAIGASKRDIRLQFVVESFSISLLGGATGIVVGIAHSRCIAVLADDMERRRETGVTRAIAASRRDIGRQFVVESFSISLLGGATGIVVGIALALGIAAFAGWPTAISPAVVLVSAAVSTAVGVA